MQFNQINVSLFNLIRLFLVKMNFRFKRFPNFLQSDEMDCGVTCLKIISKYYGKLISTKKLKELCNSSKEGVSFSDLENASKILGFDSFGVALPISELKQISLPAILHWDQNHFVVLYKVVSNNYYISDPAIGLTRYSQSSLQEHWESNSIKENGFALVMTPSPKFYKLQSSDSDISLNWKSIVEYFYPYKKIIYQLLWGLIIGLLLQTSIPLLTQYVVDVGIKGNDISLVNLILFAQISLWLAQISVSTLNSWILLHISSRVNISLLTDLLIKIIAMPLRFFDTKTHGDIIQRINDQERIESFLTGNTINAFFSLLTMILFGTLLLIYDLLIFSVFFAGTVIYLIWIFMFLPARRKLDNERFKISSENQNKLVELIQGIREIKNNNAEMKKRWTWEDLQVNLFQYKVKSLKLSQTQHVGSMAISQIRGILITYLSAKYVIGGEITLGAMIAIQYIVGAVSSPVESLLGFIQSYQDAKMSLSRLNEVFEQDDEIKLDKEYLSEIPNDKSIHFQGVSFGYEGANGSHVFENLNLKIPAGKTTAIVGESGSGKSSILKLLMKYNDCFKGNITIGGISIKDIDFKVWRKACGVVMQDSFIFDDTIEGNIALSEEQIDDVKMLEIIDLVRLTEFINSLPLGLKTIVGKAGSGLSQGQRQRILIARALYKMPDYLFLDEATSALDANTEKLLSDNLSKFLKNRTALIIAHRLSTVKNADNIIVLKRGQIIEQGTHLELVKLGGLYLELIKNQLDIGG
ncbi:peptidase domain-containing ABC transporter [Sphingobacterium populi]|uniref:Peptidase domain-containing ABC transporter n=2 Tax=Sphingobacteriaceae TaxID=84566 RepID=A0ABW5U9F3_9SPHI